MSMHIAQSTPDSRVPPIEPSRLPLLSEDRSPLPNSQDYGESITSKPAPVAKSWTHLVAGGYVAHSFVQT